MFFNNKFNTFFGLNLTLVYTFPMCMTWRFHFPLRNYDFKPASVMAGQSAKMGPVLRGEISNTQSRPLNGHPPSNLLRVCAYVTEKLPVYRVTWGKAPSFGDDLSLTYLFASTSEKSYKQIQKCAIFPNCYSAQVFWLINTFPTW